MRIASKIWNPVAEVRVAWIGLYFSGKSNNKSDSFDRCAEMALWALSKGGQASTSWEVSILGPLFQI